MARPQKDGMDYFPHDVYSTSDEKVEPLLFLYGAAGYAFFFIHLEYIYRSSNFEFDVCDAETRHILCTKMRICADEYEQILQTALKRGLFDQDYFEKTGRLTSDGIKKRVKPVVDKRNKMRELRDNTQEKVCGGVCAAETPPQTHIEKKRKEKERKVENTSTTTAREENEFFKMHVGWEPSGHFEVLAKTAGVQPPGHERLSVILQDFVPYWMSKTRQGTQHDWDLALVKSIKAGFYDKQRGAQKNGSATNFDSIDFQAGATRDEDIPDFLRGSSH